MKKLLVVCSFVALTAACAQGTVNPADMSADTSTPTPDMTTMTPVDMGTDETEPDMTPAPVDMCDVCCPGQRTCDDETTIGICRSDGSGFDPMPCGTDQVCSDGTCISASACTPGAVDCFDDQTAIRCRQSGEGYVQMTCDTGFVCSQGECTDKVPLGGGCSVDDDCASGNCRCGTDDGCPASLGGGICTDTDCTVDSCGMSASCLDSAVVPTGVEDYDHCVASCSEDDPCPTGSKCVGVPVKTGGNQFEYRDSCYFSGVKGFGDDCSADAECLTGACLQNYFDTGMCTRRCDDDGLCPDGGACVELRTDEFWCTLTCGDGSFVGSDPCPLDEPVDRFDVTCSNKSAKNGGVLRVCTAT